MKVAANPNKKNSLDWLVSARGYAMYGIFFGHIMLAYYTVGKDSSLFMTRFLQVSLIPFFVVLTGAFYQRPNVRFWQYFKLGLCRRIVPVYFFTLLVIPFILLTLKNSFFIDVVRWLPLYLVGIPMLSWPTWFLVCLFSSELIYFVIYPWLKNKPHFWPYIILAYLIAWSFNTYKMLLAPWAEQLTLVWMLHSSPLFIMLFLLGAEYKKAILKLGRWKLSKVFLLLVCSYAIVVIAVILNDSFPSNAGRGLRQYISDDMPVMFIGQYGHILWFLLAIVFSVSGFFALGRLLPRTRVMLLVGEHSMSIFCLNAIFHQVFNIELVKILPLPSNDWYWALIYSMLIGFAQLILSLLAAIALNKYLPQLTGKPMLKGPLLPAIYKKSE